MREVWEAGWEAGLLLAVKGGFKQKYLRTVRLILLLHANATGTHGSVAVRSCPVF
jgi:hypothetical protein